jgi:hypothetical protein
MPLIKPQDLRRQQTRYEEGMDDSLSAGFLMTGGGSAHTKGSYAQLIPSTPFPSDGMLVYVGSQQRKHFGS